MAHYQVLVIGSGPGGYVTAIRAAQLGFDVAVVEKNELGGVCLNWGCIPTKALLHSAQIFRQTQEGVDRGLVLTGPVNFDLEAAIKYSRKVAGQLNRGVAGLLKKNGITVLFGHGRLLDGKTVSITGADREEKTITADQIILATGARPRIPTGVDTKSDRVWTSRDALAVTERPERLVVIGAGAIGIEFTSFYSAIGTHVTLLEAAERIVPTEDAEISAFLSNELTEYGVKIHTQAMVDDTDETDSGIRVYFRQDGQRCVLEADRLIVAVGIVGNVESLGLENTKVDVVDSHIVVDEWSSTGEPSVCAIGDVAGPPWLAHKASHEGVACVERLAGLAEAQSIQPNAIPSCVYSDPQVASVGLTEAEAIALGHEVDVGRFSFRANGKALVSGERDGISKIILDKHTGELLGAHLIGPDVTELIGTYSLGRVLETTEIELERTVFPHPTLSEGLHESVLDAIGRPIHM